MLRAPLYQNSLGAPMCSVKGVSDGGIIEILGRGPNCYAPGPIQPENIFLPAHDPVGKNPVRPELSGPGIFFAGNILPVIF